MIIKNLPSDFQGNIKLLILQVKNNHLIKL